MRCFPIRCFPLLPVASRCLPGRRIIPRIPNPWCGSVASRSAASRCFPLYRHRPFRAVVPAKRNRDFSDVCRRCLATVTCQTMDTNEAHEKAHLCVTCGSGNPECIPKFWTLSVTIFKLVFPESFDICWCRPELPRERFAFFFGIFKLPVAGSNFFDACRR